MNAHRWIATRAEEQTMSTTTGTGRFVWYELVTTDVSKAIAFYTHVTGWKSDVWQTPSGDIHLFKTDQGPVANLRTSTGEKGPNGAVWWSSSVTVASADETAA